MTAVEPESRTDLLQVVQDAGEDFEWYPTTGEMIDAVARCISKDHPSILDIGAGDGRVLTSLGKRCNGATLYAIEKSLTLMASHPESITPLGTDFHEQNLNAIQVDYIFCNPPYSEFEHWAAKIITAGFAKSAFLILPTRWTESIEIATALKTRDAHARVIFTGDFLNAERRARAVVNILQVKGFKNGNLHFRFMPAAIRALNVEAGRLMGWIRTAADVVSQLDYTAAEAERAFVSSVQLGAGSVKRLMAPNQ